jgi:hypothetical protein
MHSKGGCKFLEIEDPKATILLWLTNQLPIYFAFPLGDFITRRPKKGSSYTINFQEHLNGDVEHGDVVDGYASEHELHKGGAAGHF